MKQNPIAVHSVTICSPTQFIVHVGYFNGKKSTRNKPTVVKTEKHWMLQIK